MELDVEVLVVDDLVGGLVLGVGVDVGGGTTRSLTRRVVDVSVDGGVCDADVRCPRSFCPQKISRWS